MTYYLEDHPNPNTPQYGWERAKLGQPGVHVSGVVGVHTSEAITDFEGVDNNAENNAAFLGRRTDYGSYTTSADADTIVPLVHPRYAAWADTTNNAHAMSVSGCLQAARWLEMTPERRRAVVVNMAIAAARMVQTAVADGYLAKPTPAVRISAAEAISGSRPGFYGHGETNPGTRYDPGAHFDWDLFLATYAATIGGINYASTDAPKEWDEMASKDEIKAAFREVAKEGPAGRDLAWFTWRESMLPGWNGDVSAAARIAGTDQAVNDIRGQVAGLTELVKQLSISTGAVIDYDAIAKAVADENAKRMAG
jgi:hypothetical protein